MPYDLFISYSRRDNQQGRITQLVDHIQTEFAAFAGRPLVPFFDVTEIQGMEDWRHRILQGLRESRLLLVCLSPSYLQSEYCQWEFNEYLKHEIGQATFGDGVAPIYFVEVPGWTDKGFEQQCATWVAELRRRQQFDLRPWFQAGEESLRDAAVQERMRQLNTQLKSRITRGERAEHSLGNVDTHNLHFIGRTTELRRLRKTVALGKVGVLTAVHGLGGVGKTALAIEYAHAFAHEYGGGRWQVRCEGKEDLRVAIAELAAPLALEFNEAETKDIDRQFQRVMAELRRLADMREPHRCLLLLDNVDKPKLLEPAQAQRLPAAEWLHVIVTTRLGESDLYGTHKDRTFLPVDELPEANALELIETYQPGSAFRSDTEREAAREIVVRLLGRFTLAVETAAVYLGQFADDVTCVGFLARLKTEGLEGLEIAVQETSEGVLHGEKRLTATLRPTFARLNESEKLALIYSALLPADHIALSWIRTLLVERFPELGPDAAPGYADPWKNLLRRLLGLRLWQLTSVMDRDRQPLVMRVHRVIQQVVRSICADPSEAEPLGGAEAIAAYRHKLISHAVARAEFLCEGWIHREHRWELDPLFSFACEALKAGDDSGLRLAHFVQNALRELGRYVDCRKLLEVTLATAVSGLPSDDLDRAAISHELAHLELELGNVSKARDLLRESLAMYADSLPSDHPQIGNSCQALGILELEFGNMSEARDLLARAVSVREKCNDPYLATSYSALGGVHRDLGDLHEARRLFALGVRTNEETLPPNHPTLANALSYLSAVELDLGALTAARTLLYRARDIYEVVYDRDHPLLLICYYNLGLVELHLGNIAEAYDLCHRAFETMEQASPDCYGMPDCCVNLGCVEAERANLKEAKELLRRAILIKEKKYQNPDHARLAGNYSTLGRIEWNSGNLGEARALLQRAIRIQREFCHPKHFCLANTYSNLASVERDLGNLNEAKELLERAIEIERESYGPDHPDLARDYSKLAVLMQDMGHPAEAKSLLQRAIGIDRKTLGSKHPSCARDYSRLAWVERTLRNWEDAEGLLSWAIDIDKNVYGPEHPNLATHYHNLAYVQADLGNYDKAGNLMREAYRLRSSKLGDEHPATLEAQRWLAKHN